MAAVADLSINAESSDSPFCASSLPALTESTSTETLTATAAETATESTAAAALADALTASHPPTDDEPPAAPWNNVEATLRRWLTPYQQVNLSREIERQRGVERRHIEATLLLLLDEKIRQHEDGWVTLEGLVGRTDLNGAAAKMLGPKVSSQR